MLININTDVLRESKLTPNQFLIAWYLFKKKPGELLEYYMLVSTEEDLRSQLDILYNKGYIFEQPYGEADYDPNKLNVSKHFTDTFSGDDFFQVFYEEYPVKSIRPNGDVDYLRADRNSSKQIYAILTKGDKQVHEHILKCLRYEVQRRTQSNSLNYMKRMNKWLASREWESYEDLVVNQSSATLNAKEGVYGSELE